MLKMLHRRLVNHKYALTYIRYIRKEKINLSEKLRLNSD